MTIELILGYMSEIYSYIIHTLCFKKCTSSVSNNKKITNFLLILILSTISMFTNLYFNNFFRIFCTLSLIIIEFKIIYKKEISDTILITLMISVVSIFVEFVFAGLLSLISSNITIVNDNYWYKTIITIIFASVLYLLVLLLHNVIFKINNKIKDRLNIEMLFGIVIIIINLFTIVYGENYKDYKIFFVIIVSIISIMAMILIILNMFLKKQRISMENEVLLKNIKAYEQIAEDYSTLRHNLNNDLAAIKTYVDSDVRELIEEKLKKYNSEYNIVIKMTNIPKGLQGLIFYKMNTINNKNINFDIKSTVNFDTFNKINKKLYSKLCDIVGISLDNAIEATLKTKEKCLFINIVQNGKDIDIKIINTFNDTLDINKIGTKQYSTKKIKSGIGLDYINKISDNNIKTKKEIISNLFIVTIKLIISS